MCVSERERENECVCLCSVCVWYERERTNVCVRVACVWYERENECVGVVCVCGMRERTNVCFCSVCVWYAALSLHTTNEYIVTHIRLIPPGILRFRSARILHRTPFSYHELNCLSSLSCCLLEVFIWICHFQQPFIFIHLFSLLSPQLSSLLQICFMCFTFLHISDLIFNLSDVRHRFNLCIL